ncbi:hypothetical protein [Pseudogracilibacillus auburnensis]|uniref:hypothetical protein n=1 Tax=Pseudogracilibacillus auburnensis TaxID=1494959 RepID=UPI001A96F3F9|nr:hypothetical protein [Pseudogracilibacillus auburnensis]MBO1003751.1 hypothetical protein [Pseudogracilibacillus auburnensis]
MTDNKSCEGKYVGGVDYATPGKDLTVKVTADVSDALKGLKAIQREARKATAALKELEQVYNKIKPVAKQCDVSDQELLSLLVRPEVSS